MSALLIPVSAVGSKDRWPVGSTVTPRLASEVILDVPPLYCVMELSAWLRSSTMLSPDSGPAFCPCCAFSASLALLYAVIKPCRLLLSPDEFWVVVIVTGVGVVCRILMVTPGARVTCLELLVVGTPLMVSAVGAPGEI